MTPPPDLSARIPTTFAPELSSLASTLDDVVHRVTTLAEQAGASHLDEVSIELFRIERNLISAARRLDKLARD
ncbi:MAG: hypothetical protein M0020_07510 [Actinomycetota bacterium]|nr:hypothetical protein [Actinomycetota bacterium]